MKILQSIEDWKKERERVSGSGSAGASVPSASSLGLVPTMGNLHRGHLSLCERSLRENDRTVVTLFVNPVQFNDPEDLKHYPRTFEEDRRLLEEAGADYLFCPPYGDLYPDDYRYRLQERDRSLDLCGADRPGHFDGVLSVVMKLFQLFRPRRSYFGEKDYQQYLLIAGMAEAFFLETEVIPCPTVREEDGLAMSSRNNLLSPEERKRAPLLYALLRRADLSCEAIREELEKNGLSVDYIKEVRGRRFGAVRSGKVRLIDNVVPEGRS